MYLPMVYTVKLCVVPYMGLHTVSWFMLLLTFHYYTIYYIAYIRYIDAIYIYHISYTIWYYIVPYHNILYHTIPQYYAILLLCNYTSTLLDCYFYRQLWEQYSGSIQQSQPTHARSANTRLWRLQRCKCLGPRFFWDCNPSRSIGLQVQTWG